MVRMEEPFVYTYKSALGLGVPTGPLQVGGAQVRPREEGSGGGTVSEVGGAWSVDACLLVLQWVRAGSASCLSGSDGCSWGIERLGQAWAHTCNTDEEVLGWKAHRVSISQTCGRKRGRSELSSWKASKAQGSALKVPPLSTIVSYVATL